MDLLKQAVHAYAARHAGLDGLAPTPIPGLMMKCIEAPGAVLRAVSKPAICLVLQGAKLIQVGRQEQVFCAGESFIIGADMPVMSRILHATPDTPYLAVALQLEMATLCDLAAHLTERPAADRTTERTLFAEDTNAALADCALRLTRLIDRPDAIPLLRPGIAQELHYWLLSGQHGEALRRLAEPTSQVGRVGAAIALLRAEYRKRIPVETLAGRAGMSLTAFYRSFKSVTSITPGQYQKRLRLIEARRLMLEDGVSASSAAFQVGYESVSQFSREYRRFFQAPPRQDTLRRRADSVGLGDGAGARTAPFPSPQDLGSSQPLAREASESRRDQTATARP